MNWEFFIDSKGTHKTDWLGGLIMTAYWLFALIGVPLLLLMALLWDGV